MDPEIVQTDPTPAPEPAPQPQPESVSKAEYDALLGKVSQLEGSLAKAGERLSIIDRVAEVVTGKSAQATLSKEDEAVLTELNRLIPGLKHLNSLPQLAQTMQTAAKTAAESLTQAAYGYQLELQQESGVKVDDPKVNFFIGTAIKEWINQDQGRRERFWRGDRTVIQEGFKDVKASVLDGLRQQSKVDTLKTNFSRPKSSAPAGGASATGTGPAAVDFTDKKSVRDAFKAALAT